MSTGRRRYPEVPGIGILVLCAAPVAWAHGGDPTHQDRGWAGAVSNSIILANLVLIVILYAAGSRRRRQRRLVGAPPARSWRPWCFGAAILVLLVALLSPVSALAERLGWVHMIQHTLLMMVAAPLFILGAPASVMAWALPGPWKRAYGRTLRRFGRWRMPNYNLTQPILIWLLFSAVLWIWHLPVLYEGALRSRAVHDLQHLTFFFAAGLFWQALLHPLRRRRLNQGLGVFYLFLASIHSTALGALMAFSPVVWYSFYETTTPALGYSALQDQQLAGYIMWMPACMIYLAIAVALFATWLVELRASAAVGMEVHVRRA